MSRSNRWQFAVLVASVALLLVTVATRKPNVVENTTPPAPTTAAPTPPRSGQPFFTEALVGEVRKLNPMLAGANQVDRDITSLIFEGLTASDEYGQVVPALAERWTVSHDAMIFTFYLRADVLWQDGVPFTSADVAFTLGVLRSPAFGRDVPGLDQLATFWRTVEVEVLDEHTVRFCLTQPLAAFPDFLRLGVLPEHALGSAPPEALLTHPFNLSPVGTGPYQLERLGVEGNRIASVQLRRAPTYMDREGARPYALDRVSFALYASFDEALAAFQRGEVTAIGSIPPERLDDVAQVPGLLVYTSVEPTIGFVLFNYEREETPIFRDQRLRSALAYGLDREAIVRTYLDGRVMLANSPLIPGGWAWTPGVRWPAYDSETARTLLSKARLEGPAAFTLLCLDEPAMVGMAEAMAEQWRALGVAVGVEAVSAETLLGQVTRRDFDAAIVELSLAGMADPDPYVFWHQGQIAGGQNYGGVDDGIISETLEQARRDPNGVNRAAWYRRFQEAFAERVPAIPLYYPVYAYGLDGRVEGVQLGLLCDPSDRFRSLWTWTYRAP
jgi:peptide/nickel transport system substrate-binding protein